MLFWLSKCVLAFLVVKVCSCFFGCQNVWLSVSIKRINNHSTKSYEMSLPFIVVGGGLSGLSAAHTLLEQGEKVCLLERNMFMGGNSTKATSGMNGGGSRTQAKMGIPDSKEIFEEDTIRGATGTHLE